VDRVALQRAIGALPVGYRTVFCLHDVEGYEHKEIAKMIGCSVGNSKSQLHKARLKLRDLLLGKQASPDASEFSELSDGLEEARSRNTAGSDGP
jgi:RNA polymerase sigma-70 factor (ECF subfamily)